MSTILVADGNALVRERLQAVLEAEADLEVVGLASDGMQAVLIATCLRPDVVVLDLRLCGGLETGGDILTRLAETRVVVLGTHPDPAYVLDAWQRGAFAYVLKTDCACELVAAVRQALQGERYLSSAIAQSEIDDYAERVGECRLPC